MKKTIQISDFKNNEIINATNKIKGGTVKGGITVVIVERSTGVITDNINGKTNVIEDNVMV